VSAPDTGQACPRWCVDTHDGEPVGERAHRARLRVVDLTTMPLLAGRHVQRLVLAQLTIGEAEHAGIGLVGLAALAREVEL